jgi:hypothetical protein
MKKHVIKKDSQIVYKFDGFRDLADHATKHRDRDGASSRGGRDNFYTTRSITEATALLVDGWDGPQAEVERIRDTVRQRFGNIDTAVWKFENGYAGQYLDVDTYLSGDPACFLNAHEDTEKRPQKFVRILVDTTYSANVPPKDIQIRGGAIIALADALNLCGYTTEVWAVSTNGGSFYGRGKGHELAVLVPVQGVGEPWDVRSASFPLANGDFLRRLVFAVMESMTESERSTFGVGAGYGSVVECRKGSLADLHCGGADIICTVHEGAIKDITKDPIKWVLTQCKNLGVISEEEATAR